MLKFLAFPAFIAGIALARMMELYETRSGHRQTRFFLLLQALLLMASQASGWRAAPFATTSLTAMATGPFAAAAMGVQNAAVRLAWSAFSPTTVKTGKTRPEQEFEGKREEELKIVADGYAKTLQAAGFSVEEGIKALLPYTEAKQRGTATASTTHVRVLYRNPANPENTWSGRGQPANG